MKEKPPIKPKAKFPNRENQLIAEIRENNGGIKTYKAPEGEELVMKIPNLKSEILDKKNEIHEKISQKAESEFSELGGVDDILDREDEVKSELRKLAAEKISQNTKNSDKINLELEKHLEKISEQSEKRMKDITGYNNPEFSDKEDKEKSENPENLGDVEEIPDKETNNSESEKRTEEEEKEKEEEEEQTINLENVKWPPENSKELKSLKKLQEKYSKKSLEYNFKTREKIPKNISEAFTESFERTYSEKPEKPETFIERVSNNIVDELGGIKDDWKKSKEKIVENHKKSIETYKKIGESFGAGTRKSLEMLKSTPEKLAGAPIKILRGAAKAGMWMNENKGKIALGAVGATVGGFLLFNLLKFVALPIVLAKEFKKEWKKH